MTKRESWWGFGLWVGILMASLIWPIGFRFWGLRESGFVNDYLLPQFLVSDALVLGILPVVVKEGFLRRGFMFFGPLLVLLLWHGRMGVLYWRFLVYPVVFYWLLSYYSKRLVKVSKWGFWILVFLGVGEFVISNILRWWPSTFKVWFLNQYIYLSSLSFPHPNVLAFVGGVLALVGGAINKEVFYLLPMVTGSVGAGVWGWLVSWLGLKKGGYKKWLAVLSVGVAVILSLGWEQVLNRGMMPVWEVSVRSFLVGHGPGEAVLAIKKNQLFNSEAYWFFQPPHNSWVIVFYDFGLLGVMWLGFWLMWLVFKLRPAARWVLAGLVLWSGLDHFFITVPSGQIFTSLVIAYLVYWRIKGPNQFEDWHGLSWGEES